MNVIGNNKHVINVCNKFNYDYKVLDEKTVELYTPIAIDFNEFDDYEREYKKFKKVMIELFTESKTNKVN